MSKNRHYLILIFSIVMVVSVFLCSCGIPSYCTLNNIVLKSNTGTNIGFTISGTDTDLNLVVEGPGVLILYTYGDQETPYSDLTNSSGLISSFNKLAENKVYIDSDNLVLEYTSGDTLKYKLYAFENIDGDNITSSKTPSYNLNLRDTGYISGNTISNATFTLNKNTFNDDKIIIALNNSNSETEQTLYADVDDDNKNYIYIYAAFSAEVGDFSNVYWSSLKYIGTITKEVE